MNAVDRWKQTPMYEAITNRCSKVTKILASMQGRLQLYGLELACFLNKIVMNHDLEMIQLASMASDVTFQCADYDDRTPLHVAGDLGFGHIYDFLVSKGADPNKADRWGKLPAIDNIKKRLNSATRLYTNASS